MPGTPDFPASGRAAPMMKNMIFMTILIAALRLSALELNSPNGQLALEFYLNGAGEPCYRLDLGEQPVILESRMGVALMDNPGLFDRFKVVKSGRTTADESWEPVWGEERRIRSHYSELA